MRLKAIGFIDGSPAGVHFDCPGCGGSHHLYTQHVAPSVVGPRWQFNDNFELPTLSPSILARGVTDAEGTPEHGKPYTCHSFVTDGRIQFLDDCTHALRGWHDLPDMS